ncbi:MAG: hypothetical protein NC089_11765 [Bacteroides sp.]|nr:hypothetical protein [Bacteroides sp.]MCM1549176.1 hypothetical protein [Clostridium sp.]
MKKIISFLICICLGIWIGGAELTRVQAANPRVMVSDYSIEEGEVLAGQPFTLNITLKNTASSVVRNLKLTVTTEKGELLPLEGAGTAYAAKIDANGEVQFSFSMKAIEGLEEKSYKLTLKTEYEGSNGVEYTVDESVFIPVKLKQRASITDIFLPDSGLELGDTVEISASVNNLGDGSLYNVTVQVSGDNVEETQSYIGNIESGKSGILDVLTKASSISQIGDKNKLIVSYEDRAGNLYKQEAEFTISVAQPMYENLELVKDTPDASGAIKTVLWVIVGVAVLAAVVWLLIRRWKRKKSILEEF